MLFMLEIKIHFLFRRVTSWFPLGIRSSSCQGSGAEPLRPHPLQLTRDPRYRLYIAISIFCKTCKCVIKCLPSNNIGSWRFEHVNSVKISNGTVRTSPVVKRHRQDGVRRLCAHPHLPLYVSGGQDGAVLLWEWSHNQQVTIQPYTQKKI